MKLAIYLGDEIGAVGYRLAGVAVSTPAKGEETDAFDVSTREASLVILSASMAARIDATKLNRALRASAPLVVLVPDASGDTPLPDVASRLRSELGFVV